MISGFFIRRPVFATVVALLTLFAGAVSLPLLPIEQYPQITPPTVRVSVSYPGADAKTLADTVTAPLEQSINGVEDMLYMKSTSSDDGTVNIDVTFALGSDADMAQVRVQNRVTEAEPRLPEEVRRQGITVLKRSPSLLIVISLVSDKGEDGEPLFSYAELSNYATLYVLDPLARVPGVGEASIFGPADFAMRVWIDPEKLEARGLTAVDVLGALRAQNVQVAAGRLGDQPAEDPYGFTYTLTAQGRFDTARQFEDIILRVGDDQRAVRVRDVARVELGAERYQSFARRNGEPGAQLPIYQLPGSNAVETVKGVIAQMEALEPFFPPGLRYEVTFDFTKFVRASIEEVIVTLVVAGVLVVLVVFVFLQDWRATLVPAITIPVSLVGTFAVLLAVGYSLNLLTMFGLVLAIGIVVDDAIVVVENCARKIDETGCCAADAATDAMREITGPIIATTLVVLAVFAPAAVLPGLTGQLYRQFAVTLSVATVFSSVNALTLSPALCALLLRPGEAGHGPRPSRLRRFVFAPFNWALDRSTTAYTRGVGKVVRLPAVVLLLYGGVAAATYFAVASTPTGFLPEEDQGYFFVNVQLPDAAKLDRTDDVLRRVEEVLLETEGVDSVIAVTGFSLITGASAPNYALGVAILDDWGERPGRPADAIIGEVMGRIAQVPEAIVFAFSPPAIRGLGQSGGFEYELQDRQDLGLDVMQRVVGELTREAMADPRIARVNTAFNASAPQRFVDIDREQVLKLGIPPRDVFDTLGTMLGSAYVNDFNLFGRVYRVYAQADAPFRQDEGDVGRLQVRNAEGDMVPLDSMVSVVPTVGPQNVVRYNLFTAASITGAAAPGVSSGQVVRAMAELSDRVLPAGMGYQWTGVTYQQEQAGGVGLIVFALAIVVVYLVLAAQYESWSIPLAILLAVPLGVLGATLGLLVRGMPLDIYAQIGLVLLVALVAKNAILIVEFAAQQRAAGKPVRDAAVEASRLRFRPILMTAFSFILGTTPLVVASGAGAVSRQTLGTAVVAGMLLATVVGLVLTPSFYAMIQGFSEAARARLRSGSPPRRASDA